jgi:hypothetical protein
MAAKSGMLHPPNKAQAGAQARPIGRVARSMSRALSEAKGVDQAKRQDPPAAAPGYSARSRNISSST